MKYSLNDASLIYFSGPISPDDRTRLCRLLRQAESAGNFPQVPRMFGAPWVVAVHENEFTSLSRLGTRLVFAGHSVKAVARQVQAWLEKQTGGRSKDERRVSSASPSPRAETPTLK